MWRAPIGVGAQGTELPFLFGSYLLDAERRELRRHGVLVALEPGTFDLLLHLIRSRDHVVGKDELLKSVWGGRIVSESTLTSRINAARKAIGDSGERQDSIRTIARKGVRFIADVTEVTGSPPGATATASSALPDRYPDIHFCTTSDGVRIAYSEMGHGPPIVRVANWLGHLELDLASPVHGPSMAKLSAENRLIRYDARGNGLSDWTVADISFEGYVRDVEAVVDAIGVERFALFGLSQAAAVAVAYAVRHPERVSHMILLSGYPRGRRKRNSARDAAQSEAFLSFMRQSRDNPERDRENKAFTQVISSVMIPDATGEQSKSFAELQHLTSNAENSVRRREVFDDMDISDLLPQVTTPTLVLNCLNDANHPFDEGRRLAAGIPGARFVALEGRNGVVLEGDPGWKRLWEEARAFLRTDPANPAPATLGKP
jgi:pimeloyl-ACP methyl ester carboxylesterase/DNA-binding winged helix-turn-helix (wHTH) protein